MHSFFTLRLSVLCIKISNCLYNTPYTVITGGHLQAISARWRSFPYYFAFFQSMFYTSYLSCQLVVLFMQPQVHFVSVAWVWIYLNLYIWGVLTYFNAEEHKLDLISLHKGVLKLCNEFHQGIKFKFKIVLPIVVFKQLQFLNQKIVERHFTQ